MEINKNDSEEEDEDGKKLEQFMRASQSAIDLFQEELAEEKNVSEDEFKKTEIENKINNENISNAPKNTNEVQKAKDIEYKHFLMTKKLFLAEKKVILVYTLRPQNYFHKKFKVKYIFCHLVFQRVKNISAGFDRFIFYKTSFF